MPTVPLPSRSPGRSGTSAEARSSSWPNEKRMPDQGPWLVSSPVDGRGHLEARSRSQRAGPRAHRASPATGRSGSRSPCFSRPANGGLVALEVARGPVVEDHVAADHASAASAGSPGPACPRGPRLGARRRGRSSRAAPKRRHRGRGSRRRAEVEDREAEPRLGDLAARGAPRSCRRAVRRRRSPERTADEGSADRSQGPRDR